MNKQSKKNKKITGGLVALSAIASVGVVTAHAQITSPEDNYVSLKDVASFDRTTTKETLNRLVEGTDGSVYMNTSSLTYVGFKTTYHDRIIKVKNNEIVWEKSIDEDDNSLRDIKATEDGGIVALFDFHGAKNPLFADMSVSGYKSLDIAIIKWDKDGNVVSKQSYGGLNDDRPSSISITSDGGYILSGSIGSWSFGDAFVMKIDKDGHREWVKTFASGHFDRFSSVIQTQDGNYVAVGKAGTASDDFADIPGLTFTGGVMFKFDKNGETLWKQGEGAVRGPVGGSATAFETVQETPSGDLAVSGVRGNQPTDGGSLLVYTTDGVQKWSKDIETNSSLWFKSTSITPDGKFVITGVISSPQFSNTGLFEGYKFPTRSTNSFIATLDSEGNTEDLKVFKEGVDRTISMTKKDGSVLVATTLRKVLSLHQYREATQVNDTTAPLLNVEGNTTDWTKDDILFTVSASDAESKVKSIQLPDGTFFEGESTVYTATDNGEYTFSVTDNAGNETSETIQVQNIDRINPTVPSVNSTPGTISLIPGTDVGSGVKEVQYSINGAEFTSYTDTLALPDGQYDIQTKTIDNVGNESEILTQTVILYAEQLAQVKQSIEEAIASGTQSSIDSAIVELEKLPSFAVEIKTLSEEILTIQKDLTTTTVQEVVATPTIENYEVAVESIDSLDTVSDRLPLSSEVVSQTKNEISDLTTEVQSTEDNLIVDMSSANGKAIHDAIRFINKVEDKPNKGLTQVAQKKIDALEDGAVKRSLQKRLDALK